VLPRPVTRCWRKFGSSERQGTLLEAEAEYRRAIENKPNNRQTHFNLGRVLVNQEKFEEGIRELKKTIEPEDENTPRYSSLPCVF